MAKRKYYKKNLDYTNILTNEFGEYPFLWVTINEPLVPSTAGYLAAEFPPEKKEPKLFARVTKHLLRSFIDNFEWREGFSKKFGLIACDYANPLLKREPRPSAYMFSEIIKENAITDEIVKKYAAEIYTKIFKN